ncbi:MAG TPA: histidine kinase dimerization/phospho-acceptor domain-containing protein [Terriglobales bacterium]|jgi:signal transduction histidine kinase
MNPAVNGERALEAATVLILADQADFARAVMGRWQAERSVPAFTLMSGDLCPGISASAFDIAIVGEVRPGVLPSILTILESVWKPVVFVAPDGATATAVRGTHTRTLVLRQYEGWLDAVVLLAAETLRCAQAVVQAGRSERRAASLEAQATLGRFMLDMRHTLNNALTSVLGNSELLLLEPGVMSAQTLEQIDTIRNMAIRMNEILQRFSSLETELRYVERQAAHEARTAARAAASM